MFINWAEVSVRFRFRDSDWNNGVGPESPLLSRSSESQTAEPVTVTATAKTSAAKAKHETLADFWRLLQKSINRSSSEVYALHHHWAQSPVKPLRKVWNSHTEASVLVFQTFHQSSDSFLLCRQPLVQRRPISQPQVTKGNRQLLISWRHENMSEYQPEKRLRSFVKLLNILQNLLKITQKC